MIRKQIERDDKVRSLVEAIEKTYAFTQEAEPIKKVESQGNILRQLLLQTAECAKFIVQYADEASFCRLSPSFIRAYAHVLYFSGCRAIKKSLSSKDDIINGFIEKFRELRNELSDTTVVNTQISVFRLIDLVTMIGG